MKNVLGDIFCCLMFFRVLFAVVDFYLQALNLCAGKNAASKPVVEQCQNT